MTDFVLIHGAFHGSWTWDAVAERLRQRGHRVFAPPLPGVGERADEAAQGISLSDQIDAVVAVIEDEDLSDVTLVGHSLGGMVVTGAADQVRDRIGHLVYLDALVPRSGESVRDIIPGEMYQHAIQATLDQGDGKVLPPIFPSEKFVDYQGAEADAFMARLTPQPFLTIVEPVFLKNKPVDRRTFIYCSGVPFGAFDGFAEEARNNPDWEYFEVQTPHDAMIVAPDRIFEILAGATR